MGTMQKGKRNAHTESAGVGLWFWHYCFSSLAALGASLFVETENGDGEWEVGLGRGQGSPYQGSLVIHILIFNNQVSSVNRVRLIIIPIYR